MAKSKVLENGLTEKLNIVLEALKGAEKGATADELFANEKVAGACKTIASVRSSLARLDKTCGLVRNTAELKNDKIARRYFAN